MESESRKIDVNRANASILATLPGIGPGLAARIIEYREITGFFQDISELSAVPGISAGRVQAIAERITASIKTAEVPVGEAQIPDEEPVSELDKALQEEQAGLEVAWSPEEDLPDPQSASIIELPALAVPRSDDKEPDIKLEDFEAIDEAEEPVIEREDLETADEAEEPDGELPEMETVDEIGEEPSEFAEETPRVVKELLVAPSERAPVGQPVIPSGRAGCTWRATLIGAVVGSLLGAALALAVLFFLNDTLRFAGARSTGDLEQEINRELTSGRQDRATLTRRLNVLQDQLESVSTAVTELKEEGTTLQQALDDAQVDMADLERMVQAVDGRIEELATAAEDFDAFLDGLRSLLSDLEETKATARPTRVPSPEPTSTPAAATETRTSPPTRTPRPTSTPFGVPKATSTP
jgi:competence ComEA-like helix-hairpin-helix protein